MAKKQLWERPSKVRDFMVNNPQQTTESNIRWVEQNRPEGDICVLESLLRTDAWEPGNSRGSVRNGLPRSTRDRGRRGRR